MKNKTIIEDKTLLEYFNAITGSFLRILLLLGALLIVGSYASWSLYFDFDFSRDNDTKGSGAVYVAPLNEVTTPNLYSDDTTKLSFIYPETGELTGVLSNRWAFNDYHLTLYKEYMYTEDNFKLFKVPSYKRLNNEGDRFNNLEQQGGQPEKIAICGGTGYRYVLTNTELGVGSRAVVNKYIGKERTTVFLHPEPNTEDERTTTYLPAFESLRCE